MLQYETSRNETLPERVAGPLKEVPWREYDLWDLLQNVYERDYSEETSKRGPFEKEGKGLQNMR